MGRILYLDVLDVKVNDLGRLQRGKDIDQRLRQWIIWHFAIVGAVTDHTPGPVDKSPPLIYIK